MNKEFLVKIATVVGLIIALIFVVGFLLVLVPYEAPNNDVEIEPFIIEQGDTVSDIAKKLNEHQLIKGTMLFKLYVRISGSSGDLQAGTYVLEGPYSIRDLSRILSSGLGGHNDVTVTIPEGSTIDDIDRIFAVAGFIQRGALRADLLDQEGYLFPDTYRFALDASEEELVARLRSTFQDRFDDNITQEQVIIASMLEREVQTDKDMRLVAGIIYKRLELGMPLQIDATVAYGVCRSRWEAGIDCAPALVNLVDNIPRDSAYNTYTRASLPAGPIANPGLRALEAVINPEPSDYLYYLSTKEGETIFSETLQQHNTARSTHLRL
jgi:UPF0755 protein